MNIKNELNAMEERLLGGGLLESILAAYWQELEEDGEDDIEREYQAGVQALSAALRGGQKQRLADMESLCAENLRYALDFGFTRGLYTGFQQYFAEKTTREPFQELVVDQLLKEPQMRRYESYYLVRQQFNGEFKELEEQLNEEGRYHLISVYNGWEERLCGVLRHAFYLGYRYALSAVERVEPIGAAARITDKILLTEHELAFTQTREERERRDPQMGGKRLFAPETGADLDAEEP